MMRWIALLSILVAGTVLFGLLPDHFNFAGMPISTLASVIAAAGMIYSVMFLSDA